MKLILASLLLLSMTIGGVKAQPNVEWFRDISFNVYSEQVFNSNADRYGNILVVNRDSNDWIITRQITSSGLCQWVDTLKQIASSDQLQCIFTSDEKGNRYCCYSTRHIDSSFQFLYQDMCLVAWSATGALKYIYTDTSITDQLPNWLYSDHLSNLYLVSLTEEYQTLSESCCLSKFDSTGTPKWNKCYSNPMSCVIYDLAVDDSGNIFFPLERHQSCEERTTIIKCNANGEELMSFELEGFTYLSKLMLWNNKLIMHGWYFDYSMINNPSYRFVECRDESGNQLWRNTYSDQDGNLNYFFAESTKNDYLYYVTGYFASSIFILKAIDLNMGYGALGIPIMVSDDQWIDMFAWLMPAENGTIYIASLTHEDIALPTHDYFNVMGISEAGTKLFETKFELLGGGGMFGGSIDEQENIYCWGNHLPDSGNYAISARIITKFCMNCLSNINGRVYVDQNDDCTHDSIDIVARDRIVQVWPTGIMSSTNNDGSYSMLVAEDGNYKLQTALPKYYHFECNSGEIPFEVIDQTVSENDFDFRLVADSEVVDLGVEATSLTPNPGFSHQLFVTVSNHGTINATGTLKVIADSNFQFQYSDPPPDSIYGNSLKWENLHLEPLQDAVFTVMLYAPPSVSADEVYHNTVTIDCKEVDVYLPDNEVIDSGLITGSFDPNMKTVEPFGLEPKGMLTELDSMLIYTIHFQNTGTDTAHFVTIIDTIDASLDPNSFELIQYSHPLELITPTAGVLKLQFDEIMLPDSATNLSSSSGFVKYSLRLRKDLAPGTVIKNRASIYFDFNPAVITNTTFSTTPLENSASEFQANNIELIPNPADHDVSIAFDAESNWSLELFDLDGVQLLNEFVANETALVVISTATLQPGLYLLRVSDEVKSITVKLVIVH